MGEEEEEEEGRLFRIVHARGAIPNEEEEEEEGGVRTTTGACLHISQYLLARESLAHTYRPKFLPSPASFLQNKFCALRLPCSAGGGVWWE